MLVVVLFKLLRELPESHISHRDIASLHALIDDEFSGFLSLCLNNHMSHMGIYFLHELIADEFLRIPFSVA